MYLFKSITYLRYPFQSYFLSDIKPCYDFIIVGCGTAGGILANRLSASGKHQVLVIEAGGDPPIESLVRYESLKILN